MTSLRRAALFAASLSMLAPSSALAQDASSQAAAQALFEQARKLMADGKFPEACPKLAESQRLDPGAGTLLNLGHCYEKSGRTASAWVTFKDAAAAADLKHRADWSRRARERAQALEPTLSKLVVDVPAEARTSGLQVRRDGVEVGSAEWGIPIPVDPGDHALEAVAPSKKRWTTMVNVLPKADTAHVVIPALADDAAQSPAAAAPIAAPALISLGTAPAPGPVPDTATHESDGSSQRAIGLVIGGVGVAGLVVGSIFGGVALSKDAASKRDCAASPCPNTPLGMQGKQENDSAKSAANVSTIALIAGGAALAAGAVIYLVAPKAKSSTAIHLEPSFGTGEVGLRLGGTL